MVETEQVNRELRGHFETHRVESDGDVPLSSERAIDIALLDLNHLRPNMGHDALVEVVRATAADFLPFLNSAGIVLRLHSFEVRKRLVVPPPPGGRFLLYLGTAGAGHPDPRRNDGTSAESEGIAEDPSWEPHLFELFDAIRANEAAALIGVGHTFALLSRWAGVATPAVRSDSKGGRCAGVQENVLTTDAVAHPWFARFARELPDGKRHRVLESRLFDMIPEPGPLPQGMTALAFELNPATRTTGAAVTMIEFARDSRGAMPRMLAVHHRPEIVDRDQALRVLTDKMRKGEVTGEWYEERARAVTEQFEGENVETGLRLTSQNTLLLPIQFQIARLIRLKREELGFTGSFHEDQLVRDFADAEEVGAQ